MKIDKTTKEYKAKRMREYRAGRRLLDEQRETVKKMKEDRIKGDDIYTIGLRYGYNPNYVCRICSDLPVKKHKNRHKLFWSSFGK